MQPLRAIRSAFAACFLAALIACGGSVTPTSPYAVPEGYVIGGQFALTEPLPQAEGPILEVDVLLDGRSIVRRSFTPGASITYFALPTVFVQPGDHELSLRIVRQTVSPNEYKAVGGIAVVNTVSRSIQQFSWPRGSSSLRTGDAISMRFTVVAD
jgi:hypothetical protein